MTRPRALLLSRKYGLRHRRILRALAWAYPAPVSLSGVIEAVWPDDNEPNSADKVIRVSIHELRRWGWVIETRHHLGYALHHSSFDRLTLPLNHERAR
jgi:DNA-binding response OmpR family regulator